jgi:hypothetical protein
MILVRVRDAASKKVVLVTEFEESETVKHLKLAIRKAAKIRTMEQQLALVVNPNVSLQSKCSSRKLQIELPPVVVQEIANFVELENSQTLANVCFTFSSPQSQ